MNGQVHYRIVMLNYREMVVMMMMYNRDYVNDWIEFDRMDVDDDDEKHLKMVVGNTEVENQHYPNWMLSESMMMLEYSFD